MTEIFGQGRAAVELASRTGRSSERTTRAHRLTVRNEHLEGLTLPWFSAGGLEVEATVANEGTDNVVPGALGGLVSGTVTGGGEYRLTGDPVRPAATGNVVGIGETHPLAPHSGQGVRRY